MQMKIKRFRSVLLDVIPLYLRLEAIASRVEAIPLRLEAIAIRCPLYLTYIYIYNHNI